uniref:Uncharacterized protein n=1 Tax=Nicotiana tabacum TaxID=4097 RepID=A0A1S3YT15_TOBAC|nr:PREDICTED: uncharacterized protein LOC107779458 [Nicotiana tabacum]
MKKKLEEAKGLWLEILTEELWAHKTTMKTSRGETPYFLVYITEAVIQFEVGELSLRYSHESDTSNDENKRQDLDEIEERWDTMYIRMGAQKQQTERYYNKKQRFDYSRLETTCSKTKPRQTGIHENADWERTRTDRTRS